MLRRHRDAGSPPTGCATPRDGGPTTSRCGSILLVVLGVLTVLSLIGLTFVLLARTESHTAANFRNMTRAEMHALGEIERLKGLLLTDDYGDTGGTPRFVAESWDYPNARDGWLFGFRGDGSAVLQASFGGAAAPTVDNDSDGVPDSVWQTFRASDGVVVNIATMVVDHDGLANVNAWGNTQEPAYGIHNSHEGLSVYELNLMRVLGLDPTDAAARAIYRRLFYGDGARSGRYGLGTDKRPGVARIDDNGDSFATLLLRDDDADGATDEEEENLDEDREHSYSNPTRSGLPDDWDWPFDLVDQWEFTRDQAAFQSRFELLTQGLNLSGTFAAGTQLGSIRRNLTTLSGDPEWPGVGAVDPANRPAVRLDLNHATPVEFSTVARQAGLTDAQARQLAVNLADFRDTDSDVTADGPYYGHERQPYVNEFFVGRWKQPGAGNPEFRAVAIELYNPYDTPINVYQWELRVTIDGDNQDTTYTVLLDDSANDGAAQTWVPALSYLTIVSVDPPNGGFQYTFQPPIRGKVLLLEPPIPPPPAKADNALPWPEPNAVYRIQLVRARQVTQRPTPINGELVIDDTLTQIDFHTVLVPTFPPLPGAGGYIDEDFIRRDAEVNRFERFDPNHTLGAWNDPTQSLAPSIAATNALIAQVQALGLAPGLQNSLVSKLQSAINSFNAGNVTAAMNKIGAFTNEVEAQSGSGIPAPAATNLIAAADIILAGIPVLPHYAVPIPNTASTTFGSVGELGEVLSFTQNGNTPYTDDYAAMPPGLPEQAIKFDLTGDGYTGGVDNPARRLLDLLCVKRPDRDGLDNNGNGVIDEPAEAEWPVYGKLNINTASLAMMSRALSNGPYATTAAVTLANRIVARRESIPGGDPFRHLGDLFRGAQMAQEMAAWGADGLDNDGDGLVDEKDEWDARFRYLANLVTTRSNVFTVFVTVEIRDPDRNQLLASRRAVAVLDRTRAAMDNRFSGATRVPYVIAPVRLETFRWITE